MSKIIKIILELAVIVFLLFYYSIISLKGVIKHNDKMRETTNVKEIVYQKNYFSKNKYYLIYKTTDGNYYGRATRDTLESLKITGTIIDYEVKEANLVIGFVGVMIMIVIPLISKPKGGT